MHPRKSHNMISYRSLDQGFPLRAPHGQRAALRTADLERGSEAKESEEQRKGLRDWRNEIEPPKRLNRRFIQAIDYLRPR